MARGYPDFFGMSVFPYHGPIEVAEYPTAIVADGDTVDLINITRKSVVHSGYLWVSGADDLELVTLSLIIDGTVSDAVDPAYLITDNLTQEGDWIFRLTLYDFDLGNATVVLSRELSVGYEYRITLFNDTGAVISAYAIVMYSPVI